MNRNRIEPKPGQESVWDYPRPPRLEASVKHIRVLLNGILIADSKQAKRVLETSHPPVYYIPPADIKMACLIPAARRSWCEWKGQASYYDIRVGKRHVEHAAWYYPKPNTDFASIKDYVAFYPSLMDACYVNGDQVRAQAGDFYGGWITSDIVGPFKGEPGTNFW